MRSPPRPSGPERDERMSSRSSHPSGAGVMAILRATYPDLTTTDQKIASLILEEPDSILRAPVADIAARSGSSQAAVSRFTARMGFRGLADFKIALALDVAANAARAGTDSIDAGDSMGQILAKVASENEQSIRDTLEVIGRSELEDSVLALRAAERIVIIGVGQMGYLAADAALKLRQTGKHVISSSDYIEQLALSHHAGARDVFLFVSYEGAAPPVLYNAELARAAGAVVIGICHAGRPALRESVDYQLGVSAHGSPYRTSAQAAHVAVVTVIDALVVGMLAKDTESAGAFEEFNSLLKTEHLE